MIKNVFVLNNNVLICTGQLMSCTDRSQTNNHFKRMNALTTMVNDLFAKFFERNLTDIKTSKKSHIVY